MYSFAAMAKKIELTHRLIHSLSGTEKRHFVVSLSDHAKRSNFAKLFQILESFPDVGKDFRNRVKQEKFNLSYENEQLLKNLLCSLREYHELATVGINTIHGIGSIEALFVKQQYELCENLVDQYILEAKERERFALVLDLLQWKWRLIIQKGDSSNILQLRANLDEEELLYLRKCENLSQYRQIQAKLNFLTSQKGLLQSENEFEEYHLLLKHPLLANPDMALSFEATTLFYNTHIRYLSQTSQLTEALKVANDFLVIYESNPIAMRYQLRSYFVALMNIINRSVQLKEYDQALETLKKVNRIKDLKGVIFNKQLEVEILNVSALYPVLLYNEKKEYVNSLVAHNTYKDIITSNKYRFDDTFWRYYYLQVARANFYTDNFQQALDNLQIILNQLKLTQRFDLELFVNILHIMVHYELGNYTLMPHLIKSTRRFAKINNFKQSLLLHFFKMASKLSVTTSVKEARDIFKSYYPIFSSTSISFEDKVIVGTLDLDYWIFGRHN